MVEQSIREHAATTPDVLALLGDLQVLGRSEFKQLLKWCACQTLLPAFCDGQCLMLHPTMPHATPLRAGDCRLGRRSPLGQPRPRSPKRARARRRWCDGQHHCLCYAWRSTEHEIVHRTRRRSCWRRWRTSKRACSSGCGARRSGGLSPRKRRGCVPPSWPRVQPLLT